MAQPQWITPPGDLGTIAEGLFFSTPVVAVDPDGGTVKYTLIAGSLPEGIQVKSNGVIEGVPAAFATVQGVPQEVSENVTSRFAVRAFVELPGSLRRIADRTFSITVTGQDLPEFITPAGSIGLFYDGDTVDFQIEFTDSDPGDVVVVTLEGGELPPGLRVTTDGLITGFITPVAPLPDTAIAGYDRDGTTYDQFPFDFSSRSISKNYQFTLQISDGKDRSQRTFEMFVVSRDSLTADTTDFTADNSLITADVVAQRAPFITNYPKNGNLGTYRHSNFFAYQFQALDLDGDPFEFVIALGDSADLPPGLTFNQNTGWLYGYLPDQGATETEFEWDVFVYKRDNPTLISTAYTYVMTTIGDVETGVVWITPQDLGSIDNGAVSLLAIEATNPAGRQLFYRLEPGDYPGLPGVYNKIPQGLQLLPSGLLAGRVSFNTFALDGGTTTFDQARATRLNVRPTTFDLLFRFTVNAYSQDGLISVFRDFEVRVNRAFNEPYESLYIQAMPGQEDRDLLDSLLQNQDIIEPQFLFRPDDPYFGRAQRIIYTHAYGLRSASLAEYVQALELNHFRKQLTLGDLRVAQARFNNTGDVVYEVVYANIVDTGVNELGESPPQTVDTAFPITVNGETVTEVYPNSLIEMRDQVIDVVGQYAQVLPLWMTSKQENGRVLGFTRAFIIAYARPGKGEELAYNIRTEWGERLNLIDFTADRYILDRQLSRNWIPYDDSTISGEWIPAESTTFDILPYYSVAINTLVGSGYEVGDRIKIMGSNLGGTNGVNDLEMTVTQVSGTGRIEKLIYFGFVDRQVPDNTVFSNLQPVNITGSGIGALVTVTVLLADGATIFDGGSLRFNSPVDEYGLTDQYNKYLLFPKVNILYGPPEPPPPPPQLTGA